MGMLPSRATRQIIALSVMIVLLAPVTCFGPNFFTNRHTRFCPITHQFAAGASCFVLDEDGQRFLIQHADLDREIRYFELRDESSSVRFPIPNSLTVLTPMAYRARLIPGRSDAVMLDDAVLRIEPF